MSVLRGRVVLAGWTVAVAVTSFGLGFTWSAFSDTTNNPGNSFTAASSFCTAGSQTVVATVDSWTNQASTGTNNGNDATLNVQSRTGQARRTFVTFTLPTIPSGCSVTSATLRLFAKTAATGRTIEVYRAAASWTESTITWANQPATTGTAVTGVSGTGWRTWTVTAHVQSMYSGTNTGFVVKDQAETGTQTRLQTYSSAEDSSNDPELIVNWS